MAYSTPLLPRMGFLGAMSGPPQKPITPDSLVPQRRQGMLAGLLGNLTSPRGLQILGATLQQMGSGGHQLTDLQQQLDEQQRQMLQDAWQRQVQDRARMGWKAEDQHNAAVDAWRSTLPPGDQLQAEVLGPEAYIRAHQPTQWEHFYGRAGRIGPDGSVQLGGRIPERPNQSLFGDGSDSPSFTPNPAGVPADDAQPQINAPRVSSQQQYDALPRGAPYIGPDGHVRVKS